VVASARVVPVLEADLSFTVSGRVETVEVTRGDDVQPGDTLAALDTDLLEASLLEAEAALAAAQAEQDLVQAGPRPAEVALAQARLSAAEGTLATAQAQRSAPDVGATRAEIAASEAQVAAASVDRLLADQAHDQTMKCVNVEIGGEMTKICPALGPIEEQARYAVHAADAAQTAAQAQLDALRASGAAEVRVADARVRTAAAQRDAAQAELETLQAGPTVQQVAAAEAAAAQAATLVQAARAALDRATLRAPFAGSVTAVDASPGETVAPGQVVVTLAETRHMLAETTDLSERDVARVTIGQPATVLLEPLGTVTEGRVAHIASQADTIGGDVVYRVLVALDETPPALRWGMTVEVQIAVE
jgi:multidrug efflux pump subunit AcrA (membrane-fusion protein)